MPDMSWRKSLYSDGMCLLDPAVLPSLWGGPKTVGLGTKIGLGAGGDAELSTHSSTAGSAQENLVPAVVGV